MSAPTSPPRPPAGEHQLRPTQRWLWLGLAASAGLALLDLVLAVLSGDPAAANISGTLALAPTLTAIGGARRHVVVVGLLAAALAALMCVVDGTPMLTTIASASVVAVATSVAAAVAGVRQSHLAQLQDRRQAARTLQAAMLTHLPDPEQLELASRYVPASEGDQVGGDWYDALVDRDGSTTLVIGDVTGHDIAAAAAMGQIRAVLRAYAVEGGQQPSQVLTRTETALERLGIDALATAVVVRVTRPEVDGAPLCITWSSAGHPPPVLLLPGGSGGSGGSGVRATPLEAPADLLLGALPGVPRADHTAELPLGATLVLHTDGLVERRDTDLDTGTRLLCAAIEREAHQGLDQMLDTVIPAVLEGRHDDDVAVLAARARR